MASNRRIGEFMIAIGAMTDNQVLEVLNAQKEGDSRRFGDIALEKGFVQDDSIKRFADYVGEAGDPPEMENGSGSQ